jgi:hypothetical protein
MHGQTINSLQYQVCHPFKGSFRYHSADSRYILSLYIEIGPLTDLPLPKKRIYVGFDNSPYRSSISAQIKKPIIVSLSERPKPLITVG